MRTRGMFLALLVLSALIGLLMLVVPALGSEEEDNFVIVGADAVATRTVDALSSPIALDPRFILEWADAINVAQIQAVPPALPLALEPRFILEWADRLAIREIQPIPHDMPTQLEPRFILERADAIRQLQLAYPCELVGEPDDPAISELEATNIQATQATITWLTDEYTDSLVEYGLAPSTYSWTAHETEYAGSHSITLSGLTPGTRYYYRVSGTDRCANSATSAEDSFITQGGDTEAPVISDVRATDITEYAATIRWTTDEMANSVIDYGVASGGPYTLTVSSPDYVVEHALDLTDLISVTTYYFRVTSADPSTNETTSGEYSFRTPGVSVYLPVILREY